MRYENEICQGCGKRFEEGDTIVVCPECGTPQHKECYAQNNCCVNEHLHSDEYEWKPKHSEKPLENQPISERSEKICPVCGYPNESDSKVCEKCGQPFEFFSDNIFTEEENRMRNGSGRYNYKPPFDVGGEPPETKSDEFFFVSPLVSDSGNEPLPDADGISAADAQMYLRANAGAYLRKFDRIKQKRFTFNFAAFVFGPFWFFYRKLVKPGIIFLTVSLCLTIAFSNPMYQVTEKMNAVTAGQISQAQELTEEKLEQIQEKLSEVISESLPVVLLFWGLQLVFHLIMALTADRLYRKKFLSDVKRIQSESGGDSRVKYAGFVKNGGTSLSYFLFAVLAEYLIETLVSYIFFS